jgi:hypothetical protein
MMKETESTSESGYPQKESEIRLKEIGREILPAALLDQPRGYFPVPTLRRPDEPYVTTLRVALYPRNAKGPELLQPRSVENTTVATQRPPHKD